MTKRSPRYPRQSLSKSLEMTKKLFDGVHQSKVDMDSAAKVIGYSGSGGGAASSALGALRQFGLVDGLRGDVAVSDLAMRILQPMNDQERAEALREAAFKPDVFRKIVEQFNGKLPQADEAIRAFLIRQEGFSVSGANELIDSIRETVSNLPEVSASPAPNDREDVGVTAPGAEPTTAIPSQEPFVNAVLGRNLPVVGELITLPLGQDCKAELRLIGEVSVSTYSRLIRHLELLKEIAAEESG